MRDQNPVRREEIRTMRASAHSKKKQKTSPVTPQKRPGGRETPSRTATGRSTCIISTPPRATDCAGRAGRSILRYSAQALTYSPKAGDGSSATPSQRTDPRTALQKQTLFLRIPHWRVKPRESPQPRRGWKRIQAGTVQANIKRKTTPSGTIFDRSWLHETAPHLLLEAMLDVEHDIVTIGD